jgi:hypothetical protein
MSVRSACEIIVTINSPQVRSARVAATVGSSSSLWMGMMGKSCPMDQVSSAERKTARVYPHHQLVMVHTRFLKLQNSEAGGAEWRKQEQAQAHNTISSGM